jgi:hypothetical protein
MLRSLRLFALLGLLCFSSFGAWAENTVGPTSQIICNKTAQLPVGPVVLTQMIAAVPGQVIFVCGWHTTNTAAAGTFSFSYGTGANCAVGTQPVIPPTNVSSSAPSADHISLATIQIPVANAFCITPSVATISSIVYFSQF